MRSMKEYQGKKILVLGGSAQQAPVIIKAKELGCYVVTCDYLPNNPGHRYADKYYNVDITDIDTVYEVAKKEDIDGIIAYASDVAAPTAARISRMLGLPGNPPEAVDILTQKHLFRDFLQKHGFPCPRFASYDDINDAYEDAPAFKLPFLVKPVDSSGSKGVVKVVNSNEIKKAIDEAFSYSRSNRIILEEFIEKDSAFQISGDGFSVDGEFVFSSYGNEYYSPHAERSHIVLGEFWPSVYDEDTLNKLDKILNSIISILGMKTSAYNIEAIRGKDGNIYVIELGPRSGGSYIPQLIEFATGVDLTEYAIRGCLGLDCSGLTRMPSQRCCGNCAIVSFEDGVLKELSIEESFKEKNIIGMYYTGVPGQEVSSYLNSSHALGTILFKADSKEEVECITSDPQKYFRVVVDKDNQVDTNF